MRRFGLVVLVGLLLFTLAALCLRLRNASERLLDISGVDLGEISSGHRVELSLFVSAGVGRDIRLVGFRNDCGCIEIPNIPLEIKDSAPQFLSIFVRAPDVLEETALQLRPQILVDGVGWATPFSIFANVKPTSLAPSGIVPSPMPSDDTALLYAPGIQPVNADAESETTGPNVSEPRREPER
jgi:hypothetical protein